MTTSCQQKTRENLDRGAERMCRPGGVRQRTAGRARRRLIDPTTCERDYSCEELEFMQAIERYKRISGRMFPTCSEVLEVIRSLGYIRPVSV